jgi:hypothetical protein
MMEFILNVALYTAVIFYGFYIMSAKLKKDIHEIVGKIKSI